MHRLSGKCYKQKRGMNVDIVPNNPGPYISPSFGEKRELREKAQPRSQGPQKRKLWEQGWERLRW